MAYTVHVQKLACALVVHMQQNQIFLCVGPNETYRNACYIMLRQTHLLIRYF